MPELAEVEFMRRQWSPGIGGVVESVQTHRTARVFRDSPAPKIRRGLTGATLMSSARSGKQMVFCFGEAGWLGVHLGMTGELLLGPPGCRAQRHDHLVLRQRGCSLVFRDPRMFGSVLFSPGPEEPSWWARRSPEILDRRFTVDALGAFLARRRRAPIKAVLLMQERFPGVGNWMADEALWRAGIHPARLAGDLSGEETHRLHHALRLVCRGALRTVVHGRDGAWGDPPHGWLFHQRWSDGGRCPKTGEPLKRAVIGGRTTCWSPAVQR